MAPFFWSASENLSEILTTRQSQLFFFALDRFDLLEGFGHDVAGLGRKAGAFELYGGVADAEFVGYFSLNVRQNTFALIEVHVRNARVQTQSVVCISQRPNMYVVDFLHTGHGEDGTSYIFHAHTLRPAFQQYMRGLPQNPDAGPQYQQANRDAQQRIDPT